MSDQTKSEKKWGRFGGNFEMILKLFVQVTTED